MGDLPLFNLQIIKQESETEQKEEIVNEVDIQNNI